MDASTENSKIPSQEPFIDAASATGGTSTSTGISNRLLDLTTAATMLMADNSRISNLETPSMADPGTPPPPPPPSSQQLHQQKLIQLFESEHVAHPSANGMMTAAPSKPPGSAQDGDINMFLHTVSMMAQVDSAQQSAAQAQVAGTPAGSKAPRRSFNSVSQSSSDERPHKCPTCFAAFSRSHDLRRHQKTHTNLKEFRCDQCGKEFTRLDALRRHLRTTQGKGGCNSGSHGGLHTGLSVGDGKPRKKNARHHRETSGGSTTSSSSTALDGDLGSTHEPMYVQAHAGSPQNQFSRVNLAKEGADKPWQIPNTAAASMLSAAAAAVGGQDLFLGMSQTDQHSSNQQQPLMPGLISAPTAVSGPTGSNTTVYLANDAPKSPPKPVARPSASPKISGHTAGIVADEHASVAVGETGGASSIDANAVMQNYAMAAAAMAGSSGSGNPPMALISFDIYNSLMAHIAGLEQRVAQYEEETKKRNLAIETMSLKLREAQVDPLPILVACGLASSIQSSDDGQHFQHASPHQPALAAGAPVSASAPKSSSASLPVPVEQNLSIPQSQTTPNTASLSSIPANIESNNDIKID